MKEQNELFEKHLEQYKGIRAREFLSYQIQACKHPNQKYLCLMRDNLIVPVLNPYFSKV